VNNSDEPQVGNALLIPLAVGGILQQRAARAILDGRTPQRLVFAPAEITPKRRKSAQDTPPQCFQCLSYLVSPDGECTVCGCFLGAGEESEGDYW
jgi:hypothetical protein